MAGAAAGPTAIQVFHDEFGEASSTAGYLIEDIYDESPVPTGILDQYGNEICRLPWRDTVPMGFHFTPDQYDEYGDFIGYPEEEDEEDEPGGQ